MSEIQLAERTEIRNTGAKYNMAGITQALALLFEPGAVVELRCVTRGNKNILSGFYNDMAMLARDAAQISGKRHGVYVTLNTVDSSLLALSCNRYREWADSCTADTDITRRRWMVIDVDAERKTGISSTNEEHEAAMDLTVTIADRLTEQGWPHPIRIDSGNGAHLLFRIDLPRDDSGLVERALKSLAMIFNTPGLRVDTSMANPSRICKLPGTLAAKGDNIPSRPHRIARILDAPNAMTVVPVELLRALANSCSEPTTTRTTTTHNSTSTFGEKYDLAGFVAQYLPDAKGPNEWNGGQIWVMKCPWRPEQDGTSAFVAQLPSGACSAGCQHDTCPGSINTGNHWLDLKAKLSGIMQLMEVKDELAIPIGDFEPLRRTEMGNAIRFVAQNGQEVRYCEGLGGWLVWNGRRWQVDATGEVQRRVKEMVKQMYVDAANEAKRNPESKHADDMWKWAMRSSSAQVIDGTLKLARSEAGITTIPEMWDSDPWLLNVENGTIDLRTGVLLPHCPANLISKLAPVTYDHDAYDPVLERYLDGVTQGDQDLKAYLQRAAGYSLTGDTREEVFFLMLGRGGGGKSTFVEMMLAMLGDYGVKAGFDTFLEGRTTPGGTRSDLMALRGARFVGATETTKTRKLAESVVKEMTGGDTVSARELHHRQVTFIPTFKIWLAANFAPEMTDNDTGLWRRQKVVPFDMVLAPGKKDEDLKIHLKTDPSARAAILQWAVVGALLWQACKLGKCPVIDRATIALQASFDPLATFLEQCCIFTPKAEVVADVLRDAYTTWARKNDVEAVSNKDWGERLTAHGCESRRESRNGVRSYYWHGVGLQNGEADNFNQAA